MGYDRDAAKRTAVIDDQSDFFEIDSNAWLTPEVRRSRQSHLACYAAAAVYYACVHQDR